MDEERRRQLLQELTEWQSEDPETYDIVMSEEGRKEFVKRGLKIAKEQENLPFLF